MLKIGTLLFSGLIFLLFVNTALADEQCLQSPYGGVVTFTTEPCKATDNQSFHHVYYTDLAGNKGEGCYIGSDGVVLVIWKDHPSAYFPVSEIGSCDPDADLKAKLKPEIEI